MWRPSSFAASGGRCGLVSHPAVVQRVRAFHAGWVAAWTVEVAVTGAPTDCCSAESAT
jgi:hypothetical protein